MICSYCGASSGWLVALSQKRLGTSSFVRSNAGGDANIVQLNWDENVSMRVQAYKKIESGADW